MLDNNETIYSHTGILTNSDVYTEITNDMHLQFLVYGDYIQPGIGGLFNKVQNNDGLTCNNPSVYIESCDLLNLNFLNFNTLLGNSSDHIWIGGSSFINHNTGKCDTYIHPKPNTCVFVFCVLWRLFVFF